MGLFHDITKSLVASEFCTTTNDYTHDRYLCSTFVLGDFLRSLYRIGIGLDPQKIRAAKVRLSISSIVRPFSFSPQSQCIGLIQLFPGETPRLQLINSSIATRAFIPCDLDAVLKPKVSSILQKIPSAVMEHHTRHMEEQAKKSGIGDLKVPETKTKTKSIL